jgi:hypothetical protein
MIGRIEITVRESTGSIKGSFGINNRVQNAVIYALSAKVRDNTNFPDAYVPNIMSISNTLLQTKTPQIQSRAILSDGGMYFYTQTQFDQGRDGMGIYHVSLMNTNFGIIASAHSEIMGVLFSPSDTIEVAYYVGLSATEANTNLRSSYFKEIAAVMTGKSTSGGLYVADNSRYVVPNKAFLLSETSGQMGSKDFTVKGTGSFVGTSEGDLEWPGVQGGDTPFYVKWVSDHYSRPDLEVGTTSLNQALKDAYPSGTNIEARFSMELQN